jgi:methanogenic corrinoid protein MtbC1
MTKTVIAAAQGECVHVAGVTNFLRLADAAGWRAVFLGPAIPIEQVLEAALRAQRSALLGLLRDGVVSQETYEELGMEIDGELGKPNLAPIPEEKVGKE